MDNLTHTAIGLFLSRAGLNRLTPRATAIAMLAANAPDADVITAAGGSLNYLNYHRHITHSFVAIPFVALACVALVRFIGRKPVRWGGAMVVAMLAVASHLLLDWTNVYGIRLLLPFSAEWFRADITNVFDLWLWGAALLGIAGPFLSRLVSSEIGGPARGKTHGRGWAIFVLLFFLAYDGWRAVEHARAVETLNSRMYDGAQPTRVLAGPHAANPLLWRGVVETPGAVSIHEMNLLHEFDPFAGAAFPKPDPSPAIDAARRDRIVQDFLRFSQFPMIRVLPLAEIDGGKRVEVVDLRFGSPIQPGFMAWATVDAQMQVRDSGFQWGGPRLR